MSSAILADRVKENTTTTGTGDLACAGAQSGYRALSSVMSDGDVAPMVCALGAEWEVFIGRYNATPNTVTRLEVKASSNAGALVSFSAGTKDLYIAAVAAQLAPIAAFPFTTADGLMFRYNAGISRTDLNTSGYATKLYDISGNARHSDTNTTNGPRFLDRGFNRGYAGLWFSGTKRITVSAIPALASPLACSIIFTIMNQTGAGPGNSHLYNWSGNPIGFGGASDVISFIFNGTLPAAHSQVSNNTTNVPQDITAHPLVGIHVYNGASSIQSLNNVEETKSPGTAATGGTNSFTIGSDSGTSPSNFGKFMLREIAVLSTVLTATQRARYLAYVRADCGIVTP